ncbi:amidase [Phyllobacterium sp. YR531]|uniref:amidase n=1 Tax=Phyllobacterium sp. YR531 TaxID=1144343 RepID=UPI00026FBA7E|nr:amidase [Phyllobacterium sp. YR531]EJN05848.1 amidase, Asp-tRNAAsn/Glu-tRNAGln amidotransferase A subunit [Phyllobacterium sp. YR531]
MSAFINRMELGRTTGLRVAIKDTIDIAGLPTRAGCRALDSTPAAAANAVVVDLILDAGCRIVGKTVPHELAFGVTGINDWAGTPQNPKFPDLIPGGSSSGSAVAVAEGSADVAIGTDTGGSIRIPAACCSVWGLKPTFGRVSRKGVMPERTTLDCVGPFARSLGGIVQAMEIIAPDFVPTAVDGAKVAMISGLANWEIDHQMDKTIARSGFETFKASLELMPVAFTAGLSLINSETWAAVGHLVATGLVGTDVADRLIAASQVDASELNDAEKVRRQFTEEVDALLNEVDVIILPTLPVFPPTVLEGRNNRSAVELTRLVRPFNLSGHPVLAMPLGPLEAGPVSLQIVGRKGEDELVCAVAALIEPVATLI